MISFLSVMALVIILFSVGLLLFLSLRAKRRPRWGCARSQHFLISPGPSDFQSKKGRAFISLWEMQASPNLTALLLWLGYRLWNALRRSVP